jgi:hypothetical protein
MQNKRTILFLTGKYSTDVAKALLERVEESKDNLGIIVNQRELESAFKVHFLDKIFPLDSKLRRATRNFNKALKGSTANKKMAQAIGFKSSNVLHSNIYNVLNRYTPDIVVVTSPHVITATLSAIHKQGKNTKVVAVCDNFVLDEQMINVNIDYFFVDNFDMRNKLTYGGINEEKIEITPFPLTKGASEIVTKEDALKKIGLDEHKKTVLVNTGGDDRFKGVITLIAAANINANVIVACSNNAQLLNLARNKGFTAYNEGINIHTAILASDLVVTSPNPAFIAESILKKKLIFGLLPLSKQEEMVLDYLSTDIIVKIEDEKCLVEKTETFISDLETGAETGYEEIYKLLESREVIDSSKLICDALIDMIVKDKEFLKSTNQE